MFPERYDNELNSLNGCRRSSKSTRAFQLGSEEKEPAACACVCRSLRDLPSNQSFAGASDDLNFFGLKNSLVGRTQNTGFSGV